MHVTESPTSAGADQFLEFCAAVTPINLEDYLPSPVPNGQWIQTSVLLTNEYFIDSSFVYFTEGNYCPNDTALYNVSIYPPTSNETLEFNICAGDSIEYMQNWYHTNAEFIDTLVSALTDCDSMYLSVKIIQEEALTNQVINTEICFGDSLLINGNYEFTSGQYIEEITSLETGCDSIVREVFLEVNPQAQQIVLDTLICEGEVLSINGIDFVQDTSLIMYVVDQNNCDSISYDLKIEIQTIQNILIDTVLCQNEVLEIEGLEFGEAVSDLLIIQNQSGCDSIVYDIEIQKLANALVTQQEFEIEKDVLTELQIEFTPSYQDVFWSPSLGLGCTDCLNPTVFLQEDQEYELEIIDDLGCSYVIVVVVKVLDTILDNETETAYYIPNIFTPDGNNNNILFVQSKSEIQMKYSLSVFDRWGGIVFDASDLTTNNSSEGWSGLNHQGQILKQGVYVYKITLESGETIFGDVALVR